MNSPLSGLLNRLEVVSREVEAALHPAGKAEVAARAAAAAGVPAELLRVSEDTVAVDLTGCSEEEAEAIGARLDEIGEFPGVLFVEVMPAGEVPPYDPPPANLPLFAPITPADAGAPWAANPVTPTPETRQKGAEDAGGAFLGPSEPAEATAEEKAARERRGAEWRAHIGDAEPAPVIECGSRFRRVEVGPPRVAGQTARFFAREGVPWVRIESGHDRLVVVERPGNPDDPARWPAEWRSFVSSVGVSDPAPASSSDPDGADAVAVNLTLGFMRGRR